MPALGGRTMAAGRKGTLHPPGCRFPPRLLWVCGFTVYGVIGACEKYAAHPLEVSSLSHTFQRQAAVFCWRLCDAREAQARREGAKE